MISIERKILILLILFLLFNIRYSKLEETICNNLTYLTLLSYTDADEIYIHSIDEKDKECIYDFYDKYVNHYVLSLHYEYKDYLRFKEGDFKGFFSNSKATLIEKNTFIYNKNLKFIPKKYDPYIEKYELSLKIELICCYCDFPDNIELDIIINPQSNKIKWITYTYTKLTDYQFIRLIPLLREEFLEINTNEKKDIKAHLIINLNKSNCKDYE
mgnify:CR=1 FL=1